MNLCRCGHLIKHHQMIFDYNSTKPITESCKAHETGLFDRCKCKKVRPLSNIGYLEEMYNAKRK